MIDFAITVVVLIAVLLILRLFPIPEPFRQILIIVVGAVVVIYLILWLAGSAPPILRR